jgi:hypothetical protein
MARRIEWLYRLQQIDTQLLLKNRRYKQVQANLGESDALRQARDRLSATQSGLARWRTTLRDLELDVAAVVAKQHENEEMLYGGQVRNPKTLTDLQNESAYLKRRREGLEEKQLEALIVVEEWTAKAAIAQEEYTVVESAWRAENADLTQEYDTLKRELAQLLVQRKALVEHVAAGDMETYEAIRRQKRGVAVAAIRNGICQACHVSLPQRAIDMVREAHELVYCGGCDRILYMPED